MLKATKLVSMKDLQRDINNAKKKQQPFSPDFDYYQPCGPCRREHHDNQYRIYAEINGKRPDYDQANNYVYYRNNDRQRFCYANSVNG